MTKKREVDINIKIDLANLPAGSGNHLPKSQQKIRLGLSVSQLAYWVRLLCEIGIIKTKNVSEVLRFVSESFSTPGAEDISYDSLRMKYYNIELSTKQGVKDFLIKQLNWIQKDLK